MHVDCLVVSSSNQLIDYRIDRVFVVHPFHFISFEAMGGALHRATRVFRMYNIDNRVEKVLSKEKPTPAPRIVPQTKNAEADDSLNIAPEQVHQRNDQLLTYLKDVKVYSTGANPVIRPLDEPKEKPGKLPALDRLAQPLDDNSPDGAFGYVEPQRIPPGRVSLRQFLAYLQQRREKPDEFTVARFSEMYTIKAELAEKIFKYHSLLSLQEVKRVQSKTSETPPQLIAEIVNNEKKSTRRPGPETGFISKY